MKVAELNRLDLFYLTKPVHKGTTTNTIYQLVEHRDDGGVVARGVLQTQYGSMNMDFYLPDFTEVDHVPLEEII